MQRIVNIPLAGLGTTACDTSGAPYPPVNGGCWTGTGFKPLVGTWPMDGCSCRPPAGSVPDAPPLHATAAAWYTTWWGVGIIAAVALLGYKRFVAKK
jgi:hypothetical protein